MTACIKPSRIAKGYARPLEVAFDAPHTSSDGGALLLHALDRQLGPTDSLGALVPDERCQVRVKHSRQVQFRQRVFQIALGYEDCNDADTLRHDPALRLGCQGELGQSLSSQPSLSRFENAANARCIRQMTHWLEDQ
jgi:hypothetical protein